MISREELRARLKVSSWASPIASFSYAIATVSFVSGVWWHPYLLASVVCYGITLWTQSRRPKMLILRRFGDAEVEVFLDQVAGGLGTFARSIWLYDARARPSIRTHLPEPWLYAARLIVWLALAWVIIGRAPDDNPSEGLWLAWMVVGSVVYHRYKAGRPPTSWLSCIGAAMVTMVMVPAPFSLPLAVSSWKAAFWLAATFAATWLTLAAILAATPLKRLFFWMYDQRVLRSPRDLARFRRELRHPVMFPRYVPLAPVGRVEVICAADMWAPAVYEAIGHSSLLIVDVSKIDDGAALTWEIEQGLLAAAPIFMTCEEQSAVRSTEVLTRLGFPNANLFRWRRDLDVPGGVSFDRDRLIDAFFATVDAHLSAELRYSPIRPSREEALAALHAATDNR